MLYRVCVPPYCFYVCVCERVCERVCVCVFLVGFAHRIVAIYFHSSIKFAYDAQHSHRAALAAAAQVFRCTQTVIPECRLLKIINRDPEAAAAVYFAFDSDPVTYIST